MKFILSTANKNQMPETTLVFRFFSLSLSLFFHILLCSSAIFLAHPPKIAETVKLQLRYNQHIKLVLFVDFKKPNVNKSVERRRKKRHTQNSIRNIFLSIPWIGRDQSKWQKIIRKYVFYAERRQRRKLKPNWRGSRDTEKRQC